MSRFRHPSLRSRPQFTGARRRFLAALTGICTLFPLSAANALAATNADLTSTQHTVAATATGAIHVGTHVMNVQAGQMLTPAESLALSQVLQTGKQTLVLGSYGNAIRGILNISTLNVGQLSTLVVPRGVSVLDNAGTSGVNVTGNLVNSGNLYLYSTQAAANTGSLNAFDIINNRTGLLSSVVPVSLLAGQNAIPRLDLNLAALDSILNAGIIRSSGAIAMSAVNSITNTGQVLAAATAGNINLVSNQINNHGLISSPVGNININGYTTGNIAIDNTSGILQATLGSINVRDASFATKSNFDLTGGNLLSQVLNIFSGNGNVLVDAKNITGLVNVNAGTAQIVAATPNLTLGTMNLVGDPTFFNTAGNVIIDTSLSVTGPLAIVAKGNIVTGTGASVIDTTGSATSHDVTLIAGANFTASKVATASDTSVNQDPVTLTITGGSTTGGKIDLATGTRILDINTSNASGAGGNVTLVAYKGTGAGSGTITLGLPATQTSNAVSVDIKTNGSSGSDGNVTVIAGATTGIGIYLGSINAVGAGSGNGGNISINTATPTITGGPLTITNGQISSGSFTPGTLTGSTVVLAGAGNSPGIKTDGNVSIQTKGNISAQGITAAGTTGINLKAGLGIFYNDNIVASNGNVTMNAGTNIYGLNHTTGQINPVTGGSSQFFLGAVVDKTDHLLFVPDYQYNEIAVINTSTNLQVATIPASSGLNHPEGMTLSNGYLYVANSGNGTINIYNASTQTLVKTVPVGGRPEAVATNPAGTVLYVVDNSSLSQFNQAAPSSLVVVDVSTPSSATVVGSPIALGPATAPGTANSQTGGVVVNPQGNLLFVSASGTRSVYVYDLSASQTSPALLRTIPLTSTAFKKEVPIFLAMDPNGTRLFVSEGFSDDPISGIKVHTTEGSIAIIDALQMSSTFGKILTVSNLPASSIPGDASFPQGISVNPTGTELYSQATYLPYLFSTYTSGTITEFIPAGQGPDGYGSNQFTAITSPNGIPVITAYSSNTANLSGANSVSIITKPTIQCGSGGNINLSTTSGNILIDYNANGGTFTAHSGGAGIVMANNVGTAASSVGTSGSAASLFEIGSVGPLNIDGAITGSKIILMTTGAANDITINAPVGTATSAVQISTGGGNILEGASANIVNGVPGGTVGSVTGKSVSLTSLSGKIDTTGAFYVDNSTGDGSSQTTTLSNASKGILRLSSVTVSGSTPSYIFNDDIGEIDWTTAPPASGAPISITSQTPFQVSTPSLTIASGGSSPSYVNDTRAVSLTGVTAAGQLVLTSHGTMTVGSNGISSPNTRIETLPFSNGNIVMDGPISAGPSGQTIITTDLSLLQGVGNYKVTGGTVNLSANGGAIGSVSVPIRTAAGVLIAGSNTNVYIRNSNSGSPLQIDAAACFNTLSITSDGDITINGGVNEANNVTVNSGGNILITPIGTVGYEDFTVSANRTGVFIGSTTKLIAAGDISTTAGFATGAIAGYVLGKTVSLQAGGSIGTNSNPILTSALTLNTKTGNLSGDNAYFTAAGVITLPFYIMSIGASSVGGTFSVNMQTDSSNPIESDIKVMGAISAPTVTLTTGAQTNGAVLLDANIGLKTAGTTTISTDIVQNAARTAHGNAIIHAAGSILSPNVNLSSLEGSIGSSAAPISITAPTGGTTLGVSAGTSSDAYIKATGALTLAGTNTAGGKLQIIDSGLLTASGSNITAQNVVLQTLSNGAINLGGSTIGGLLGPATSITINASGSGTINGGTFLGNTVSFISGTGNIGSGQAPSVSGGSMSAKSGGFSDVNLLFTGPETLLASNSGAVNTRTTPGSTGNFVLNGFDNTSDLTIGGKVTGGTITITLNGSNLIGSTSTTAALVSKNVSLSNTGGGSLGSLMEVQVQASNLSVNDVGGSAGIANSVVPITLTGTNTAANYNLTSSTSVTLLGNVSGTSGVSIQIPTGSASIIEKGGLVSSPLVLLGTNLGSIGSTAAPVIIDTSVGSTAPNVVATTTLQGSGTVNLTTNGTQAAPGNGLIIGNASLTGTSSSGGAFTVTDWAQSGKGITVNGDIQVGSVKSATNRNLTLIENGAGSFLNENSNLTVTGGSIVLNESDTSSSSTAINFGPSVVIGTFTSKASVSIGSITIAIGSLPAALNDPNVTQAFNVPTGAITTPNALPGHVYGGDTPGNVTIVNGGSGTVLNADKANLIIEVPNINAGTITFGNANLITADPQVPVSAPVMLAAPAVAAIVVPSNSSLPATPVVPVFNTTESQSAAASSNVAMATAQQLPFSAMQQEMFEPECIAVSNGVRTGSPRSSTGSTLFATDKDVALTVTGGTLNIHAGAVVLVVQQPDGTVSIFDLHDDHSDDVVFKSAKNEIALAPGRHITIATGNVDDFAAVNPFDCIAHRNMQTAHGSDTVFSSEFSIPSAMKGLRVLSALASSRDAHDAKLSQQILRDAAIIMQLRSGDGRYQRMGAKRPASKLALAE